MASNEGGTTLEPAKGTAEHLVPLPGCSVEPVVRRHSARRLPDALGGIELGRVAGQAVQLDSVRVFSEPRLPLVVEPMARPIVDDEEDFPRRVLLNQLFEKLVKRVPVEDWRESEGEVSVLEGDGAEDVRRLPEPEGVHARLHSDSRPRLVQGPVEPKTGLVPEHHNAATSSGFFLMAGKRWCTQSSCAAASARARRLRGRCTEKPSWCRRSGT